MLVAFEHFDCDMSCSFFHVSCVGVHWAWMRGVYGFHQIWKFCSLVLHILFLSPLYFPLLWGLQFCCVFGWLKLSHGSLMFFLFLKFFFLSLCYVLDSFCCFVFSSIISSIITFLPLLHYNEAYYCVLLLLYLKYFSYLYFLWHCPF